MALEEDFLGNLKEIIAKVEDDSTWEEIKNEEPCEDNFCTRKFKAKLADSSAIVDVDKLKEEIKQEIVDALHQSLKSPEPKKEDKEEEKPKEEVIEEPLEDEEEKEDDRGAVEKLNDEDIPQEDEEIEEAYPFESEVTPPTNIDDDGTQFPCTATKNLITATSCHGCMYNAGQDQVNCQFPTAANPNGTDPLQKEGKRIKAEDEDSQYDICSNCGNVEEHIPGVVARDKVCPECGGMMTAKIAKLGQTPDPNIRMLPQDQLSVEYEKYPSGRKETVILDLDNPDPDLLAMFPKSVRDKIGALINQYEYCSQLETDLKVERKSRDDMADQLAHDKAINQILQVKRIIIKLTTMTYNFFRWVRPANNVTAAQILKVLEDSHSEITDWRKEVEEDLRKDIPLKEHYKFEREKEQVKKRTKKSSEVEAGFFSDTWNKILETGKKYLNRLNGLVEELETLTTGSGTMGSVAKKELVAVDLKDEIINLGDLVEIVGNPETTEEDFVSVHGDNILGKLVK